MASGWASGNTQLSLTALSGGSFGTTNLSVQSGDIVIYSVAEAIQAGPPTYVISGTAGEAYTNLYGISGNDTASLFQSVNYRFCTGGETAINCSGFNASIRYGRVALAHVWRGVDETTQMDVTAVSGLGINTGRPDPQPITPITPGAVVVVAGAGGTYATGVGLSNFVAPTSYAFNMVGHRSGTNVSGSGITSAIFARYWSGFDVEDPGAFTSGSAATQNAWTAVTIALRPRTCNSNFFTSQDSG